MFENVKGTDKMKALVREREGFKGSFKSMSALLLKLTDGLLTNIDEDCVFKRKFGSEATTKLQVLVVRFNERLKNEPFGIVLRRPDFGSSPDIIVKSLIMGGKLRHGFIICDMLSDKMGERKRSG